MCVYMYDYHCMCFQVSVMCVGLYPKQGCLAASSTLLVQTSRACRVLSCDDCCCVHLCAVEPYLMSSIRAA